MVTVNYKRVVEYWKTNRPVDLKTMDVTGKRTETDEWRIRIYEEDTLISEFGPSSLWLKVSFSQRRPATNAQEWS